jgi:uncharacterized damage-inducible protein DinB
MTVNSAMLDSWERQARIMNSVAALVTDQNRKQKPSTDGWSLETHVAHVHQVRRYWLHQLDTDTAKSLPQTISDDWVTPCVDLHQAKLALFQSAEAIRSVIAKRLEEPLQPAGGYENPVLFLQHMIWHEGWHVGLMMLALRLAGEEPSEEWQETHIWGEWRTEIWP